MAQQRQHAVTKMDITLKRSKTYHLAPPPGTGKHIKYDLSQLRLGPGKLEHWRRERKHDQKEPRQITKLGPTHHDNTNKGTRLIPHKTRQ